MWHWIEAIVLVTLIYYTYTYTHTFTQSSIHYHNGRLRGNCTGLAFQADGMWNDSLVHESGADSPGYRDRNARLAIRY